MAGSFSGTWGVVKMGNLYGVTEKKAAALAQRMEACGIDESDLEETFIKGGGPGGQKINKSSNTVRLVHRATGLEVKMGKERTQGLNRYYARKRLCELVEAHEMGAKSPEAIKAEKIRKQKQRRKRRSRSGKSRS